MIANLFGIAIDVFYESSKITIKGLYYATNWGYYYMYGRQAELEQIELDERNRKDMLDKMDTLIKQNSELIQINKQLRKELNVETIELTETAESVETDESIEPA